MSDPWHSIWFPDSQSCPPNQTILTAIFKGIQPSIVLGQYNRTFCADYFFLPLSVKGKTPKIQHLVTPTHPTLASGRVERVIPSVPSILASGSGGQDWIKDLLLQSQFGYGQSNHLCNWKTLIDQSQGFLFFFFLGHIRTVPLGSYKTVYSAGGLFALNEVLTEPNRNLSYSLYWLILTICISLSKYRLERFELMGKKSGTNNSQRFAIINSPD